MDLILNEQLLGGEDKYEQVIRETLDEYVA